MNVCIACIVCIVFGLKAVVLDLSEALLDLKAVVAVWATAGLSVSVCVLGLSVCIVLQARLALTETVCNGGKTKSVA
jgi:hypothetical protein